MLKLLPVAVAAIMLWSTAAHATASWGVTIHNCVPQKIDDKYDPDPADRVEIIASTDELPSPRLNYMTVVHHMRNGVTHIRSDQY
jgi:hypothetical protein